MSMLLAGPMMNSTVDGGGIPTSGLVAHYTMDSISGTTLIDETGNYDGTISGATDGGGYLDFDGVNDRVDISLPPQPQSFAWFVDVTPDVIGENDSLIGFIGGYGASLLRFNSSNLRFYVYTASYTIFETAVSASNNYRIVAQHDGTDTELWVNGSLIDSASSIGSIVYQGGESGRRLGANYNLTSGRFFDGKMYEFAEYNRILTSSEISTHFS